MKWRNVPENNINLHKKTNHETLSNILSVPTFLHMGEKFQTQDIKGRANPHWYHSDPNTCWECVLDTFDDQLIEPELVIGSAVPSKWRWSEPFEIWTQSPPNVCVCSAHELFSASFFCPPSPWLHSRLNWRNRCVNFSYLPFFYTFWPIRRGWKLNFASFFSDRYVKLTHRLCKLF